VISVHVHNEKAHTYSIMNTELAFRRLFIPSQI